jgi:oligoendopeptidase F
MNLLPFGKLPAARPRKFVPQNADLGDWPRIAPLFDQLERRAPQLKTVAELEAWLLDWSEFSAALDEEASRRYIAMTCHTDNADAEKAYLHFVENIEPQLKPHQFALEKIYASHPLREKLSPERFNVFDRDVKNHVELFRPENVPLETE